MKQTYLPSEVAKSLQITERYALKLLPTIKEIKLVRFGKFVRIDKESYDRWFNDGAPPGETNETYTPKEIAEILRLGVRNVYIQLQTTDAFKVFTIGRNIRIHKQSFDSWLS